MYGIFLEHTLGDLLSQTGQTLGGAVLQCHSAGLSQHGVAGFTDRLNGEQLRRGQSAGKGYDLRSCGYFEYLSDV